jgi:hypothetical protein
MAHGKSGSSAKSSRPADESISPLVEPQNQMGVASDSDAAALADGASPANRRSQPDRPFCAKVHAIQTMIDAKRGREAPWTAREIDKPSRAAVARHALDSFDRFNRTQEHPGSDARLFAGNVHHERRTVNKINVGVAVLEEERAIARRRAAKRVAGGIVREIGFGLDDPSTQASRREFAHKRLADQKSRELDGAGWKLVAAQAPNGRNFHATCAGRERRRRPF